MHQIFLGAEPPSVLRDNGEELRAANPDWKHQFYGDDPAGRFIADHYGRTMLNLYRRISPDYAAARSSSVPHRRRRAWA